VSVLSLLCWWVAQGARSAVARRGGFFGSERHVGRPWRVLVPEPEAAILGALVLDLLALFPMLSALLDLVTPT
jgi:hypothetical protein